MAKNARREFMKGAAAVAAGAALAPTLTAAAPLAWRDATAFLALLRATYLAEIQRLAEQLRPRFESGELYATRETDPEETDWRDTPHGRIEALAADFFGLIVTIREPGDGYIYYDGDDARAHLVLALSPHRETTSDGHYSTCYEATEALAWDLIATARARGWYAPTADELEDPLARAA